MSDKDSDGYTYQIQTAKEKMTKNKNNEKHILGNTRKGEKKRNMKKKREK